MKAPITPDEAAAAAKRALDAQVETARAVAAAGVDVDAARTALDHALARFDTAWTAAIRSGWSDGALRDLGLTRADSNGRTRLRRRKATPTPRSTPTPTGSSPSID